MVSLHNSNFLRTSITCLLGMVLSASAFAVEVKAIGSLKKGTILTSAHLEIITEDDENYDEIKSQYVGLEMKRNIADGNKISLAHVGAPVLVKRNAPVTMTYTYGAMRLSARGRALGGGSLGDDIIVLNVSSRKKVYGVISGPDMVEIVR